MAYNPWNMTPYQQNFNAYPPYQPPAQMQFPQQQIQSPPMPQNKPVTASLFGRFVNSLEEITPNEVPMDGNAAIFPQTDYSCIYIRGWTGQGELKTLKFVPERTETPQKENEGNSVPDNSEALKMAIMERLDAFESNIEKLIQKKPQNQQQNNPKRRINNELGADGNDND